MAAGARHQDARPLGLGGPGPGYRSRLLDSTDQLVPDGLRAVAEQPVRDAQRNAAAVIAAAQQVVAAVDTPAAQARATGRRYGISGEIWD